MMTFCKLSWRFLLLLVCLSLTFSSANAQTITFEKTFGRGSSDQGYSVIESSDGGFVVVGCTAVSPEVGYDVYLIKTDNSGNIEWEKTFGGTGFDFGHSVIESSDGGFVIAGGTESSGAGYYDVYLIKTDNSGNFLWEKTFGGTGWDYGFSVCESSDGGFVIAGETELRDIGYDVYLIKTDNSGNFVWEKTFGGGVWFDQATSVIESSDGGFVITGRIYSFGTGYNVFLVKTDNSGNITWQKTFGGGSDDQGYSVIESSDGGYVIAGETESSGAGGRDVYLIKTDNSGNLTWQKTFGGGSDDQGNSVIESSDGGFVIAGETESSGAGYYDVYLIKTDNSGDFLWEKTFGGTDNDYGNSVIESSDGGYLITGRTASSGPGSEAVYLIKTDSEGNVNSCTDWTPGLDTVLYTAFEVELFDPTDSTGSLGTITAFGADMLVQRSDPYEASPDIWRMDTEIQAFSGSGESPLMGGAFTIDLNPQVTSGGYIQMCESCNDNWAESHFTINYRINTSLPYPNNMYYGLALMDLPCDELWDPLPPGDEPFTPPNGHDYNDPRKLAIINANGDTVAFTMKRHRVDEDPFGSCCVLETSQDYVTSACLIVTEVECEAAGGVYYGNNSLCDPDGNDYDLDGIGDSCDQCDDFPPIIQNPVGDTLWVEFSAPSFAYYPVITDPDNVSHTITYTEYPSYWCWLSGDSVVAGEVPDTVIVERLTVVVEDTCNVTTRSFIVGIYLCGDFNEDGVLDISDLVYLIDYMFNGGPPPPVLAAGDVDGDGEDINISDLVYMIDYMFIGGEPPICP